MSNGFFARVPPVQGESEVEAAGSGAVCRGKAGAHLLTRKSAVYRPPFPVRTCRTTFSFSPRGRWPERCSLPRVKASFRPPSRTDTREKSVNREPSARLSRVRRRISARFQFFSTVALSAGKAGTPTRTQTVSRTRAKYHSSRCFRWRRRHGHPSLAAPGPGVASDVRSGEVRPDEL